MKKGRVKGMLHCLLCVQIPPPPPPLPLSVDLQLPLQHAYAALPTCVCSMASSLHMSGGKMSWRVAAHWPHLMKNCAQGGARCGREQPCKATAA